MTNTGTPQLLNGIEADIAELANLENYFTIHLPKITAEEAIVALNKIRNWEKQSRKKIEHPDLVDD